MQKSFFEENKGFECIFFELKYGWFQTRLADLKKHQTPKFLLMQDFFMIFLKKSSFSTFSYIFKNNQLHILISLYALYFM